MVVTGTYNPHLVALSILVAAFASYTALDVRGRVAATRGAAPRVWLAAPAIAMGGGIWSMHFIAMLAFNMTIPMSYDIGLTALSLVVAIFVTGAGFYFINRESTPPRSLVFSGIFMGLGIAAMHYIGMAALREHAEISYDFLFVGLSLVIAIGASTAALWLVFRTTEFGQKLVAAVVMGVAISGMHYSAMRGTTFAVHGPVHEARGYASLDQTNLALVVAGITLVILAFALIASLQQENSERRRAEEALRRSEAYLAQAQTVSHTGSFGWNPATGESYWSAETFRIFEYDRAITPTAELVDQRVHPEDVAGFRQVAERAAHDAQDFAHECRLRMPDGRVKYLQVAAHATRNETGGLHFVGAMMDVTAIRLAELELHKTRTELARVTRMTSLGALTASIAHEVNQPLMAIVTNAESCLLWLAKEQPNLDNARAAAERIVKNGHRAGDVVQSIRALSRKSASEMVRLDIGRVIGDTLELMQSEFHHHDVSLETRFSDALGFIKGDRTQLQQVIVNLVMNAIEAMCASSGSPRILRVMTEPDPNGGVLTVVEDSGSGIDAGTLDRIFDPMFTTKPDGMGLGLSICRSIVEAHGGRLWAMPNPTGGSIFRFSIPAATDRASIEAAS